MTEQVIRNSLQLSIIRYPLKNLKFISIGIKKYATTVQTTIAHDINVVSYNNNNNKITLTRLQNKSERRKSPCVQYDFISMFFIIEFRQKSES